MSATLSAEFAVYLQDPIWQFHGKPPRRQSYMSLIVFITVCPQLQQQFHTPISPIRHARARCRGSQHPQPQVLHWPQGRCHSGAWIPSPCFRTTTATIQGTRSTRGPSTARRFRAYNHIQHYRSIRGPARMRGIDRLEGIRIRYLIGSPGYSQYIHGCLLQLQDYK